MQKLTPLSNLLAEKNVNRVSIYGGYVIILFLIYWDVQTLKPERMCCYHELQ